MKDYSLVPATQDDFSFLKSLQIVTMKEHVEKIWGWDDAQQDRLFQERFEPAKIQIIKVNGQSAGRLSIEDRGDELFLATILLSPEFQSTGLGAVIITDIMRDAAEKKMPLSLTVLRPNIRARRFYERLGFAVYQEDETRFYMRWANADANTV